MRTQRADYRGTGDRTKQPWRRFQGTRSRDFATRDVFLKFGPSNAGSSYINKSVAVFPNLALFPPCRLIMDHHYIHNSFISTLSRTPSDETVCINTVNPATSRRTRKRFTNVQLMMLENLFHQNSHPSREDREAVAKAGAM